MKRMKRKTQTKARSIPQHMFQVYMPASDHDFQKVTEHLFTIAEENGYHIYKCTSCKVTGRVWPGEPVIYIGAQYGANYRLATCPGPPSSYVRPVMNGTAVVEIPSEPRMVRRVTPKMVRRVTPKMVRR